jgi:hypothetical protein
MFLNLFIFLLTIQKEVNKLREILLKNMRFSVSTLMKDLFHDQSTTDKDGNVVVHKATFWKLLTKLKVQLTQDRFEQFWNHKFRNAYVNQHDILAVFFGLNSLCNSWTADEDHIDYKNFPKSVKKMLSMLLDLTIKCELFFHREKKTVSIMHIMDFIKTLTAGKRDYLVFKDLSTCMHFTQFSVLEIKQVFKRFNPSSLNERLNAYNICIQLS